MSEYQYYEFRAVDRVLTDRQMRELRAISTRAAITRTSFSNDYTYGELKVNPRDLLVRYFDASLYFANWLFLELAFRYPKGSVDMKALRRYATGHTVEIRSTARDVIVTISLESTGESFDTADDGTSWLPSLIALELTSRVATSGLSIWHGCWMSSASTVAATPSARQVERWITSLDTDEHVALLRLVKLRSIEIVRVGTS